MDNSSEPIKHSIEQFQTVVRYIAAGFVAVGIYALTKPVAAGGWEAFLKDSFWSVIILSGVVGLLIYALHHAIIDNYFFRYTIWRLRTTDPSLFDGEPKPQKVKGKRRQNPTPYLMENLILQRCTRRTCGDAVDRAMQHYMDNQLSLLAFIYESAYPMLVLPLLFSTLDRASGVSWEASWGRNRIAVACIGLLLLYAGRSLDRTVTKRELRLASWQAGTPARTNR